MNHKELLVTCLKRTLETGGTAENETPDLKIISDLIDKIPTMADVTAIEFVKKFGEAEFNEIAKSIADSYAYGEFSDSEGTDVLAFLKDVCYPLYEDLLNDNYLTKYQSGITGRVFNLRTMQQADVGVNFNTMLEMYKQRTKPEVH